MNDADQFETFVRTYQDMVFAVAVRLLGNPVEAEDVSQTVFLKAFQHFGEVQASPAAPGWLKTVTRNACLNHLSRYRARWQFFSELQRTGDDGDDFEGRLISPQSPVDAVEQADRYAHLEQALQQLPDHQRVPLVLFHFEELSYQDIASSIGVSLGKVKTDIHRGREALKQLLTSHHGSR